jgi:hypothetical protein
MPPCLPRGALPACSGASGAPTASAQGGWSRSCSDSGRLLYPRIDPAIITLISAGDWALLGRKEGWPTGRWGAGRPALRRRAVRGGSHARQSDT